MPTPTLPRFRLVNRQVNYTIMTDITNKDAHRQAFYITTTLPYVNADPHIGFALEIVQADAIARFKRLEGYDVFFSTGTDEHGQKMLRAASANGVTPQQWVDKLVSESWFPLLQTLEEDSKAFDTLLHWGQRNNWTMKDIEDMTGLGNRTKQWVVASLPFLLGIEPDGGQNGNLRPISVSPSVSLLPGAPGRRHRVGSGGGREGPAPGRPAHGCRRARGGGRGPQLRRPGLAVRRGR